MSPNEIAAIQRELLRRKNADPRYISRLAKSMTAWSKETISEFARGKFRGDPQELAVALKVRFQAGTGKTDTGMIE